VELEQARFDFDRVDIDAAGNDHVAHTVAEVEEAVLVEEADVAARDQPSRSISARASDLPW